jgi:hypothetical protein
MRFFLAASLLAVGCSPLAAQVPAATPDPIPKAPATAANAPVPTIPPQVENTDVGFSYSLPSDWVFVPLPPPPKVTVPYPQLVAPKKGDACIEVAFTAKHGTPASVVVVLALPFACYGQALTATDLPGFGDGAAEGLKQAFDVTGPLEGNYTLGSHTVWIERAKGTPKGHPENPFTFEIACTLLDKGAACWMTMAADDASLQAFEQSPVVLDGDSEAALVPASAFPPKPS